MGDARRAEIAAAARAILEAEGPDAVTMRAVAERLGIRAPSLYKHVPDRDAILVALTAVGLAESGAALSAAIEGSRDPLADLALAYRRWALAHPHLYRLVNDRPLPRSELPAGEEAAAAAPLLVVMGRDLRAARAAWGLAHGLASLELAGRFPPGADVDAAWAAGIEALRSLAKGRRSRG